jgi:hypothetical protein
VHGQVIQRGRRRKRARHRAKLAEQYGSGSAPANLVRRLVDALRGPEFMLGRQGDPELESA